jgi:hypothetical protein
MSTLLGPLTVLVTSRYRKGSTMFRRVLVGVDGRSGGRDAIALARRLAAPDGVITLAHIYGEDLLIGRGGALTVIASPPGEPSSCSSNQGLGVDVTEPDRARPGR